jgi:hypothetical protein
MVMVIVRLLLGEHHRLRGWQAVEANSPRLKTIVRWSRMGIFDRIFANLAAESGPPARVMIDSSHLKAHRTAASLLKRGGIHPVSSAARKAV